MTIAVIILIILLDQGSKYIVTKNLKPLGSFTLINKILDFNYIENTGAAFGIFAGGRWFFICLTVIIIFVILYYYIKLPKISPYNIVRFSLCLIIGGALGNFIDRINKGYVVDFIHVTLIDFPVFNIADICVVLGACLLAFLLLFVVKDEVL